MHRGRAEPASSCAPRRCTVYELSFSQRKSTSPPTARSSDVRRRGDGGLAGGRRNGFCDCLFHLHAARPRDAQMPLTRDAKRLLAGGVVVATLGIAFVVAGLHEPADDQLPAMAGSEAVASPPGSPAAPEDSGFSPSEVGAAKPQVRSVFDGRSDLFETAEFLLAVEGVGSLQYAAAVARIGEACEAAHSVAIAPKDHLGAYVPAHGAAMILMERCRRWVDEIDKLPRPRHEISASDLMVRAVNSLTPTPGGLGPGKLRADTPIVRDAVRQIENGRHASEFQEAMAVWFDAHPQSRASLTSRNRLSHEDFGVAFILGTRLLECEISASCGPRSFATIETCVHTGCSPDLWYQEAIRTSMPPGISSAAFEVRNLLVRIRTEAANPAPGSP